MEPIKVSVNVTVDFSEGVKAFVAGLMSGVKQSTSKPAATTKPAAPAKPAAPTKPAAPAPEAPAQEPASEQAQEATSITIEDVRKALSEKVNNHRNEIKDKLSELGAPSVTRLGQDKYQDMYNFLIALD